MRIACVLIEHLPFKLELEGNPGLLHHQVIIFQLHGSRRTVVDASPSVKGVMPGMSLQEAQAQCKDAVLIEADTAEYEREFNGILLRLGTRSPVIQPGELGCAYVGLDGLEDTYGSRERLIELLLQAVPQHLKPRLGVSDGKFPAYLAALSAEPGRAYRLSQESGQFVAPFSVDALPVPWEVKARLHGFGLHALGQVAQLSIGPLQAQFGKMGARLWQLAHGIDDSPLLPLRQEEEVTALLTFPTPMANLEPLLLAVDHLLARLFAKPEVRGRYPRIALLKGHVANKPAWQRRMVFKVAVGSRARAYSILKAALENSALPGPLEDLCLTLRDFAGETGLQESLFREIRQREQLRESIAQIKASLGWNPIYQVREVEPWSRIRERRRALVTYDP